MSWIFATIDTKPDWFPKDLPVFSIKGKKLLIITGGNPETCFYSGNEQEGFVVCGLGMDKRNILSSEDWSRLIENSQTPTDGHYVIFRWDKDKIRAENDILGLRELFWEKKGEGFVISTRLDWVAKACNKATIDFLKIGSLWLGPSLMNWESFIDDIYRLGPGGCVEYTLDAFNIDNRRKFERPAGTKVSVDDVLESLIDAISVEPETGKKLSLSGGLDSRALLAALHGTRQKWEAFTFGFHDEPDCEIVFSMAKNKKFPLDFWETEIPTGDEIWRIFCEHTARKLMTLPVSTAIALDTLEKLRGRDCITIDGGLGEILRQRVLRKLAPVPNMPLNTRIVRKLLSSPYPAIFNRDAMNQMEQGFMTDIETALEMSRGMTAGETAEMWAIWFRLPNFSGFEQARLDEITRNFMPFVQPSIINKGLLMSHSDRRNSALHLALLKRFAPELSKYRLARFGRKLPFTIGVNPYLMRMWLPFTKDCGTPIENRFFRNNIEFVKDRIFDRLSSQQFAENPIYNHEFIKFGIKNYLNGKDSAKPIIDWWLTVELFLESLRK